MPRELDDDLQYDIDEAILDYLLYTSTELLLDYSSKCETEFVQNAIDEHDRYIQMVDSFSTIFRLKYSDIQVPSILEFRLRLLKFTKLFTSRLMTTEAGITPESLQGLRNTNSNRAKDFLSHFNSDRDLNLTPFEVAPPFPPELRLNHRPKPSSAVSHGSLTSVSLLDTLPLFMALSAAQNLLGDKEVTEPWMRLAARYMAEAALEQYVAYGAQGLLMLNEAFAYAFDIESAAETGSDDLLIANLFWAGEGSGEVEGWRDIRQAYLRLLIPPDNIPLHEHLMRTEAESLSLQEFEELLLEFLNGLLHAQPPPLYVQIEKGEIAGLSKEESTLFMEEILQRLY